MLRRLQFMPHGELWHLQYVWLHQHEINSAGFYFRGNCFFVVQRITQPEFAMALSVLWWFKVMRMPVTKMGTKMAFKHGPEGAKIVCFGKCIFLTNKRHWCAGREKCLAKSGWCTSSPCRELTNSWPAIQWMQWSCHRSASTACDA